MKSERYEERRPLFDRVFANGVTDFVHPTGVVGVKIVPGLKEWDLDPYFASPYAGRAKGSGDYSIFLGDSEETARAEVFQDSLFSGYPPNTWSLKYRYVGNILNINRIQDKEFTNQFLQASGAYKHECSQDARYYLTEKGYTDTFDSIGWTSVRGDSLGIGGFVYNWVSGVKPDFEYLGKVRLDTGM